MTSDQETVDDLVRQIEQMGYSAELSHRTVGSIVGKVRAMESMLFELRSERDAAIRERDEARRLYCAEGECSLNMAKEVAIRYGWDCFKEPTP